MITTERDDEATDVLRLSAEIVSAYVAQNNVPTSSIGTLIHSVHDALTGRGRPVQRHLLRQPVQA